MAKEETTTKKQRRPSAKKRDIQASKRRIRNRTYKSKVRSAIRQYEEALKNGEKEQVKEKLSAAYSIIDKCVKEGVFKPNKGDRTKARIAVRTASL